MAGNQMEATFGTRTLTKALTTFADDSLDKFFLGIFEKGDQLRPEGRLVEWDEQEYHRHLAPVVGHTSPFPKLEETTRKNKASSMMHVKLHKDIPGERLFFDRAAGSLRPNASDVVAREQRDLMLAIMKTVEWACAQTLQGALVVSRQTVPGSESEFTINWGLSTHTRSANWDLATTPIVSDELPKIEAAYLQTSGMLPGTAILNDVTERYLKSNTEVKSWAKELYAAEALTSSINDARLLRSMRLNGLEWRSNPGGFVPKGARPAPGQTVAFQRYMADDKLIVLPPDQRLPDVIALALGHGIVPRTLWGGEGSMGIELAPSPGWYSYSEAISNPPGVRLYAGWVGLPIVLFPKGVLVATVKA